jgi:hypothetical protein
MIYLFAPALISFVVIGIINLNDINPWRSKLEEA